MMPVYTAEDSYVLKDGVVFLSLMTALHFPKEDEERLEGESGWAMRERTEEDRYALARSITGECQRVAGALNAAEGGK